MAMDFATIGIGLRRLAEYLEAPLTSLCMTQSWTSNPNPVAVN